MSRRYSPCLFVLLLLTATPHTAADPLRQTFDRTRPAVVKIRAADTGHAATGFAWRSAHTVVTSLHVVDGSERITVDYQQPHVTRPAQVQRVLRDADLVLLRVENPPAIEALRENTALPDVNQQIHALGFPLNVRELSSFSFSIRYGGRKLADNVSSRVLAKLRDNGYPSPELEVVKLGTESLMPGLSGAPIIDNAGAVVAIGNGGLEEGALNISWGIPAHQLLRLERSSETTLPGARGTRELFAAELDVSIGATVSIAGARLTKVRTRRLGELIATADDQLGLSQLSANFAMFEPMRFRYDIYQDARSGATIVVPDGAQLQAAESGPQEVGLPDGAGSAVSMYLQLTRTASLIDTQRVSEQFEQWIGRRYFNFFWQPDPQWSYLGPIQRFDGLLVNRRAFLGQTPDGQGKYAFETLAARNLMFIGAAVVNENRSIAALAHLNQCTLYQFPQPDCNDVYAAERAWAQLVLGVQLTGFSL